MISCVHLTNNCNLSFEPARLQWTSWLDYNDKAWSIIAHWYNQNEFMIIFISSTYEFHKLVWVHKFISLSQIAVDLCTHMFFIMQCFVGLWKIQSDTSENQLTPSQRTHRQPPHKSCSSTQQNPNQSKQLWPHYEVQERRLLLGNSVHDGRHLYGTNSHKTIERIRESASEHILRTWGSIDLIIVTVLRETEC